MISPPVPITTLAVVLEDGRQSDLARLMRGRVTALQFVLTGCSSVCPVLGTIFSRVQPELGDGGGFQLVSLSLDPEHDTPESFSAWLRRFDANAFWRGAIPQTGQAGIADLLREWGLSSGTSSAFHTETVLLADRAARLVFRFPDLPDPVAVARMMRRLASV